MANSPSEEIVRLPDAPGIVEPDPFAGPDHPMRKLTRGVAFDGLWNADRASKVAAVFDGLAEEWSARVDPTKLAPVGDALERGDCPLDARWLELGSGTGAGTAELGKRVSELVALDLSAEMLANAPAHLAPKLRGDASCLPFADDTFDAVLMLNMLLFPAEMDRVLRPEGVIVWVNSLGDQTPIHLPVADVLEAMPGAWTASTANAGSGFWATVRRA